ncbi:raffinose/stachyose/melibiose transport system permease protein [Sinosporangium album]|uniref:Raffinose/stachyose/melibiose transport system permease protein n=1 Tax=Sinosporangium album TaxID=504805 RepID=A0A1G8B6K7_9ACTN|nr:carbohydrate ABC transporter permease [Sinosporangium album]SDH28643.1 raffinose/stachyose/melibiose transport system permease protein [Sinosporangium album]
MTAVLDRTHGRRPAAPGRRRRRGSRRTARSPIAYLILSILALYAVGPMLVFVLASLKTPSEISENPLGLPGEFRWENFTTAWVEANMGAGLMNSAVIAISTAAGVCLIAGCAAYALTRLNLPKPGVFILYLLVATSLPIQLFLVPLLSLWTKIGLYDSRFGLIIIYWAIYSPFATLLIRSFLLAVPKEYEAAARIDGAGEITVFTRIVFPLIWPGVLTAGLVAGLQAYNEFLLAVTFIQDSANLPASISLYSFQQGFSPNWALVSAAGLIMVLPVLALFIVLQRRFVEGYTSSGMAG